VKIDFATWWSVYCNSSSLRGCTPEQLEKIKELCEKAFKAGKIAG